MSVDLADVGRKAMGVGRFALGIYSNRIQVLYHGVIKNDLLSQLTLPAGRSDPNVVYDRMRRLGPILPTRLGNLSTTSYEVCTQILRNRSFGVSDPAAPRPGEEMMDLSLLALNPPDHTRLRRLAAPAFSPRRMEGYQAFVDTTIERLLDQLPERQPFDLMSSFASPLPIAVITRMLGMTEDLDRMRWFGATAAAALDGVQSLLQGAELFVMDQEMRAGFARLLERAAREGGDDLVSALVEQQIDGAPITTQELTSLIGLLLLAGFETSVNGIGNGVIALLRHREQWERLVANPDLAPAVVDEVLRYASPVQFAVRTLLSGTEPVELAGTTIAPGQWILLLLAAAGRDPAVFPDPDRFDISRANAADHLAFSGGVHYCLGAGLARMEMASAFRALAIRYPGLRLAGSPVMRQATALRGPSRLLVTT